MEPVNFTDIFGTATRRRYFPTLDDAAKAVSEYEKACSSSFSIRSTIKKRGRVAKRIYICSRAARVLQPTQGMRSKSSQQTGCSARFSFNVLNGSFRITSSFLEHNHAIDPVAITFEARRRRLSSEELRIITPWLSAGTPSYFVSSFVRNVFHKNISTKDVCNLRARLYAERRKPGYLIQLAQDLNATGNCVCIRDSHNYVTHFIIMTAEQKRLFLRFPELIGIDATYRTCRERYFLFQLVVIDGCGIGIPICFGFLSNERTQAIETFLVTFKSFIGDALVETMIMDDSAATQAAISTVFPNVTQLLCRVHILRNLMKRVSISLKKLLFSIHLLNL